MTWELYALGFCAFGLLIGLPCYEAFLERQYQKKHGHSWHYLYNSSSLRRCHLCGKTEWKATKGFWWAEKDPPRYSAQCLAQDPNEPCPTCNFGKVQVLLPNGWGSTSETCPDCLGSGLKPRPVLPEDRQERI